MKTPFRLSPATVDEHLQKVGAEAFNKFERCGPFSMLLGLNSPLPVDGSSVWIKKYAI